MRKFLILAVFALGGCHAGPSLEWARNEVAAERTMFELVGPSWAAYVVADSNATSLQRKLAPAVVESWGERIEAAEGVIRAAEGGAP